MLGRAMHYSPEARVLLVLSMFVNHLPCWTLFPLYLSSAYQRACHIEGIVKVELHFWNMQQEMVWRRRESVHRVIGVSRTLDSSSRQYQDHTPAFLDASQVKTHT